MAFLTEKQIDARLEPVCRDISMPDGSKRAFTMMQMHWDSADYVIGRYSDWNDLLRKALSMSEAYDVDLDQALAAVATRLHEWIKKSVAGPLQVEPGICPLIHKVPHPYSYISGIDARDG